MRKIMETVLRRYGIFLQVVHGGVSTPVKAFFYPGSSKTAPDAVTPLGRICQGQYLYTGPSSQEVEEGDQIVVDGIGYLVTRAESYRDNKEIVYRWAVCRRKGGEDTWASQV